MPIRRTLLAATIVLAVAADAHAQPLAESTPVAPASVDRLGHHTRLAQANKRKARKAKKAKRRAKLAKKRAKVRERIRALRAWKITEALELDEKTAAKLFPILGTYDAKFEKAQQASSELRARTRAELEQPAPDLGKLDALVDQLMKQQREMWNLQEARFRAVRKVLSPAQTAELLIILPEIDRTLHRQIRRAMKGGGGHLEQPFGPQPRTPHRSDSTPLNPFD